MNQIYLFQNIVSRKPAKKAKSPKPVDLNKPKRPLTSFFLFRRAAKEEFAGMSGAEMSKCISQKWRLLNDDLKLPFKQEAEKLMHRYKQSMKEYEQSDSYREYEQQLKVWEQKRTGRESKQERSSESDSYDCDDDDDEDEDDEDEDDEDEDEEDEEEEEDEDEEDQDEEDEDDEDEDDEDEDEDDEDEEDSSQEQDPSLSEDNDV